jgi:hypothetical protein
MHGTNINTQYTLAIHGGHFIHTESAIGTQRIQHCHKVNELSGLNELITRACNELIKPVTARISFARL